MSFKKLYIYFTNEEKLLLRQIIENINTKNINITNHCKQRMIEKNIDKTDILNCLKLSFDVIELHQKGWDTRVLLRGRAKDELGRNTCMSLSLVTFRIITVYKNYANDNHRTLVEENYEDIEVEDLLKRLL